MFKRQVKNLKTDRPRETFVFFVSSQLKMSATAVRGSEAFSAIGIGATDVMRSVSLKGDEMVSEVTNEHKVTNGRKVVNGREVGGKVFAVCREFFVTSFFDYW